MDRTKQVKDQLRRFSNYLKRNGFKCTRQRAVVVESFVRANGHLSAEELHELVKDRDKTIGFTTVFRTLKALTDSGLAQQVDLSDGYARFERLYQRPRHFHLVCTECSRAIEFLSVALEQLEEEIISEYRFQPAELNLQVVGVCHECQTRRKTTHRSVDQDVVFFRDALRIALETKKRGIKFYTALFHTISNLEDNSFLLEVLQDERIQLSELEREWDRLIRENKHILEAPIFLHFNYEELKTIFPSQDEVKKAMGGSCIEPAEAVRLAVKMEEEAHHFFDKYSRKFSYRRGRDLFSKLAAKEHRHHEILQVAYRRLQDD